MRFLALLIIATAYAAAAERPFDYPVFSRRAEFEAQFTKVDYPDSQREGTKIAIKNREKKTVFEHELTRDVACNAQWTHDTKFLVITAQNEGGHQPWRYSVYVFSVDASEIRQLQEPQKEPVISADMFFQPPHTVILIGHTFEHHLPAPEDPVLLRFDLETLWPKLQKV